MIFTLPITVKNNAPLGYWLTPILVDALSKQTQEEGILFYGRLGLRSPISSQEDLFHRNLDFLDLTCIRKPDSEFKYELLNLSKEICGSGRVEYREQECYRCLCGRLELPVHIARFAKEKTFVRDGSFYICKVCKNLGGIVRVTGCFLRVELGWSFESIHIYPKWYRGEIIELIRQLREQGIPLSHTRATGLIQNGMNLDVEFVWSLIPLLLSQQHPNERIRLVVTNHVLRQAIVALLLAKFLNPNLQADLIVSPYITHPGVLEKWNMNRLSGLGFTGDLLRLMLIGSLGWQGKDTLLYDVPTSIEYRRFKLFKRRIQEAQDEERGEVSYAPHESLHNLCQQSITNGIKHVFNPGHFDYQVLTGLF